MPATDDRQAGWFRRSRAASSRSQDGQDRFDAMVSALQQIGAEGQLGDFPGWLGPDA